MTTLTQQRPMARRDGVLVEELGDEAVLYDPGTDHFVGLNEVAYFVWQRCDGATVAEIAAALEQERSLDDAVEVVWLALSLLSDDGLLDGPIVVPEHPVATTVGSVEDGDEADGGPMSRRTMLAIAGAGVALPIVASIVAPSAAAAQSIGGGGGAPLVPVDCVVDAWSAWSSCTKPCGGGTRTRTRSVLVDPQNGGAPCPTLVQTDSCNDQPCPVDCVVSAWSDWSTCDAACGGGTQTRTRTVVTFPAFGGAPCPTLSQSQDCNTQPCP